MYDLLVWLLSQVWFGLFVLFFGHSYWLSVVESHGCSFEGLYCFFVMVTSFVSYGSGSGLLVVHSGWYWGYWLGCLLSILVELFPGCWFVISSWWRLVASACLFPIVVHGSG